MKTLPSWVEPLLGVFPRPVLRWAESHLLTPIGSPAVGTPPRDFRVAFVKQALWPDHPVLPAGAPYRDMILSTKKKTGAMALFSDWRADLWIVAEDPAPECGVWKEASAGDPDPDRTLQTRRAAAKDFPPGRVASVDRVDWGAYHLVISSNLSVPTRVVKNFPATVWAYWVEETGTPSYRRSWHAPLAGYDIFLNGLFRRFRVRPGLSRHTVEMPFNFQRPGSYEVFCDAQPRQGILLEKQTAARLTPDQLRGLAPWGPIRAVGGNPETVIRALVGSKYYLQFGGNTIWGNGMIEAAVAGCLAISEPRLMSNNSSLVLPGLEPRTWPEVPALLQKLESDPGLFRALQKLQQDLAEWLSFGRPAADLLAAVHRIRRERGLPPLA